MLTITRKTVIGSLTWLKQYLLLGCSTFLLYKVKVDYCIKITVNQTLFAHQLDRRIDLHTGMFFFAWEMLLKQTMLWIHSSYSPSW